MSEQRPFLTQKEFSPVSAPSRPLTAILLVAVLLAMTRPALGSKPQDDAGGTVPAHGGSGQARPLGAKAAGKAIVTVEEVYPAIYAEPFDSSAVAQLLRQPVARSAHEGKPQAGTIHCFVKEMGCYGFRDWSRLRPHPYLTWALPGVEFYSSPFDEGFTEIPPIRLYIAYRAGRVYALPTEVNLLLRDCGMGFEVADVPVWARVLIILRSLPWGEDPKTEAMFTGESPLVKELRIDRISMLGDTLGGFSGDPSACSLLVECRVGADAVEEYIGTWLRRDRKSGRVTILPHVLRGCYLRLLSSDVTSRRALRPLDDPFRRQLHGLQSRWRDLAYDVNYRFSDAFRAWSMVRKFALVLGAALFMALLALVWKLARRRRRGRH